MSKISKWGNSLGLRLPASIAQVAGLRSGSPVSVRLLDNGKILVTPLGGAATVGNQDLNIKPDFASSKW